MNWLSSTPAWWPRAQAQGLVSGGAPAEMDEEPNGFVIALALLGALVCALAGGGFLLMLLDSDFWLRSPAAYGVTALGIAGAAWMLARGRSVFATCLALVLWGLFCALFLLRLDEDVHGHRLGLWLFTGLLALLQWLGARLAHARWVKRICGLVFGVCVYLFLQNSLADVPLALMLNLAGVVLAVAWWLYLRKEPQRLARVQAAPACRALMGWAAFADSAVLGVLLFAAVGAAGLGRSDALAYELFGLSMTGEHSQRYWQSMALVRSGFAALLVLLATGMLSAFWKKHQMAQPQTLATLLGAGALLAVAAWFSPALGLLSLLAAAALVAGRWRIAALCALAALWALGSFYYSLAWPLAHKGLGLAVLGAALLLVLYSLRVWAARQAAAGAETHGEPPSAAWSRGRVLGLAAAAVLVLGLVNWDVRGKEQVIAEGQPVLVPLRPVDPRSLMQGDYMALNFSLPPEVEAVLKASMAPTALVRATLDAQGVATVRGMADSRSDAAPEEILLPLKRLKGRWVLVTDAYFFPEGTGRVFERARFGDFRVLPDGRALLVGLADKQGRPIPVPKPGADAGQPEGMEDAAPALEATPPVQ